MSATLDEQAARVAELIRAPGGDGPPTLQRLGGAGAWLVERGGARLVLKRGRPEQDRADVTWEHDHLRRLAEVGFPASVPVPAFDGQSWTRQDDRIWASLSYLPGRPLVSEPAPDMEAAGAFLARYHQAARSIPTPRQRPTATGLHQLHDAMPWGLLRVALGDVTRLELCIAMLTSLEGALRTLTSERPDPLVIHGDPTNDNLIVDGTPPRIVGLIDFGSTHVAPWPADIAAGLWRSGRHDPEGVEYDPDRISRFVAGYHRESRLSSPVARAIPLLMQGRGLQLMSRWLRRLPRGQPTGPVPEILLTFNRTAWLDQHRRETVEAVYAGRELVDGR